MNRTLWAILLPSFFLFSCSQDSEASLSIAGSDTILELVQSQAEDFVQKTGLPVNVTGGGSGVGINLVEDGSIDIANASRALTPEERNPDLIQVRIANDLISILVNKSNPIKTLTHSQLAAIYTGAISNWKKLGWKDMPISLYGRQSSSGTYQYVQSAILHKSDYSPRVKEMTGNSQIVRSLKADKAGIAYISFGYYLPQKDKLNLVALDGITPLQTGDMSHYVLKRGVYEIYNRKNSKIRLIRRWYSYILGKEGKRKSIKMGFLPLTKEQQKESEKQAGL